MTAIERLPRPVIYLLKRYVRLSPLSHTISVECMGQTARFVVETQAEVDHFHWNLRTERPALRDFVAEVDSSDVVFDVGAGVGLYSCFAAENGADVVAIEPQPASARRCRENLEGSTHPAKVIRAAFGERTTQARFVPDDRGLVAGAGRGAVSAAPDEGTAATVRRGDDYVAEHDVSPPDVLKIDVEGAEAAVVSGFRDTLSDHVRVVYCELHGDGSTTDAVESRLSDHGFELSTLVDRQETRIVKAIHPGRM